MEGRYGKPGLDCLVDLIDSIFLAMKLSSYSLLGLGVLLVHKQPGYAALQLVPFELRHFLLCHMIIIR